MGLLTFKKGVHPPHGKHLAEESAIEVYTTKGDLIFPMSQHIGAPCEPTVKKGDHVLVGQVIGAAKGFVSSPIHCSVSGTVKDIAPVLHTSGNKVLSVIVENDNKYEEVEKIPHENYESLSKAELVDIIKNAGIVGLGGACFPTHVKLTPPDTCKIDHIIVNAAECEPYLTCDHRLMLEKPIEIVEGLKILSHMFPNVKIHMGIENNKPDAIKTMTNAIAGLNNIEVCVLKTKYPQGAEKQLIYAVTGREVPSGKLPSDAGCIVQNVGTVFAIREAVILGKPLTDRVITITGEAITTPKNLRVKLGTCLQELIDECGGFKEEPGKVISGGPMMGTALFSLNIPSIKGTSGILCIPKSMLSLDEETSCIRCGKCTDACPMYLIPSDLNALVLRKDYDGFDANHGCDCIECGCCSFICPAKRHLTQSIREGKKTAMANRKKKK